MSPASSATGGNAPIALFAFRRPDHLARTLAALAANSGAGGHDLRAFVDGPRHAGDAPGLAAVRRVLDDWAGRGAFRSLTVDAQEGNLGLRRSIIRGVGQVVAESGEVIVIEDDLLTSPDFLRFCRDGLACYRDDPRVASIHGYQYPVRGVLPDTFFLRGADCWGWATWRRAWAAYDDDAAGLLHRLEASGQRWAFDQDGWRQLSRMLADAAVGRVDSWAIRWHASAYLADLVTLYPGQSLVQNIGLDASGTHCAGMDDHRVEIALQGPPIIRQPTVEDPQAASAIRAWFAAGVGWRGRLRRAAARLGIHR